MTQLLNYVYLPIQSKNENCEQPKDKETESAQQYYNFQFASQTSINQLVDHQQQTHEKVIPFTNYQYWNYKILLNVYQSKSYFSMEAKILNPKGQILKVISQYHRTFLYRRFLYKKTDIIAKINPLSGQISFCIPFFFNNSSDFAFLQTSRKKLAEIIIQEMPIFQQIVDLVQRNQHPRELSEEQQVSTFVRFCTKKSGLQKKTSIRHYFQKRKEVKCRTYDGCGQIKIQKSSSQAVKQILNYLVNPLSKIEEINESMQNLSIKPETKRIMNTVQQSFIRSQSNFKTIQQINLSKKGTERLINSIGEMVARRQSKKIQKIDQSNMGSLPLQVQIHRISIVQKTYKLLSYFPTNLQFSFLYNYMKCNQIQSSYDNNVILQLAVHRQQLNRYLQTSKQSISFSTKLRILSQIISATHLLQNKCSIIVTNLGFNNFSVTKNITLKINHIQRFLKVEESQKIDLSPDINLKNVQNQMNIGRIYSRIFYKKDILYFKPSKNVKRLRLSQVYDNKYEEKQIVIDKLYEQCGYYGPKKLMCLLSCIFIPYIPTISYDAIKKDPISRNLKWSISSLVKILENVC